ncbi:MFS transporter [Fructilactobacillus cliffordii]|uniref:MFS transporter n=1 Tax=Fructilactobacillus cliffordii TaxID=2940299 RepID=UPI00209279CB|nr:MFS transporter [Fructilactobacillus cliffordii]USS85845.1 MFS transporter [Fructilactobacillus cliffordii]
MQKFRTWGPAVLLIGIATALIMLMQWKVGTVILGYDTFFHFNRIYDAAEQLQTGHFNYFMSNFGYQRSGQMINALYGPYFAYLLGMLLWLTGSWFNFQLLTGFLILAGAGFSAWLIFRRLHVQPFLAMLGALIYLSQNFITYWITSSAFLDWGAMLLPLAVLSGLTLLNGNPRRISWGLGLIMAVLIEVHTLSAVMTCLLLLPFALVGWNRSREKGRYLVRLGLNVLLAVVLTANYLVAFVNIALHNHLVAPFAVKSLRTGAMHLLSPNWMQADVGIVFIVILLLQLLMLVVVRPLRRLNYFLTGVGIFFFYISSILFPWRTVQRLFPFLQHFLQFPSRFFSFAALLLLAGLLMSLTQVLQTPRFRWSFGSVYALVGLLAVAAVMLGMRNVKIQADNNWNSGMRPPQVGVYTPIKHRYDYYQPGVTSQTLKVDFASHDLARPLLTERRGMTDYLPNYSGRTNVKHLQQQYQAQIMQRNRWVHKWVDESGRMHVTWNSPQPGLVTIPVVAYHDTTVRLNGQQLRRGKQADTSHYQVTDIGTIQVMQNLGTNRLLVTYAAPFFVKGAVLVSLGAWILVLSWGLVLMLRKVGKFTKKRMS